MKQATVPYVFSALNGSSPCNPALSCYKANCFNDANNSYARVFSVSQRFENFAEPCYVLKNGTYFNDLYMPYQPCCKSCENCNVPQNSTRSEP